MRSKYLKSTYILTGNFHHKSAKNAESARKEFVTKVAGLENLTFDMGNAKYAVKYQKTVNMVANRIQHNYKGGPKMAKAIRDMILPTIVTPNYPTPVAGTVINKGVNYIWEQEVQEAMKRVALLNKSKKQVYAFVFRQCLPELISKMQGGGRYAQSIRIRTLSNYFSSPVGTAAALIIISRVGTRLREQHTEYSSTTKVMM